MFVDLTQYITPMTVCVYKEGLSKPSILEKIAEFASFIAGGSEQLKYIIYDGLQSREMLGSTGLTRGLALPHCRVEGISDFIIGMLVSPEGVAYGSLDGKLSRVFVFVIAPKERDNEYLNIMSEIGSFLSNEEWITTLSECTDNEELYKAFLKLWEEYIKESHNGT